MHQCITKAMAVVAASVMTLLPVYAASAQGSSGSSTKTPIKHVVVIFQENVSFDHYFGTYPHAFNLPGETPFHAEENTPESNTLLSSGLLSNNPNKANPFRIPPSVPVTCDEDHNYGDEQGAADGGLMDKFVEKLSCSHGDVELCSILRDERQLLGHNLWAIHSWRSQFGCREYVPWNTCATKTQWQ